MDLCAAVCASNLLRSSIPADNAVTHKILNLTFHKPTYMGEIIYLYAEVTELRKKAISINVKAYREKRECGVRDFVAEGIFVFISKCGGNYVDHHLTLEDQ
jgi:acyl-CoA hydrolase